MAAKLDHDQRTLPKQRTLAATGCTPSPLLDSPRCRAVAAGGGEGRGENSSKNSRIEPMNLRKTSNTQHPTSNNQWFSMPLIGGWVLDVGCSMFPRVHGEGQSE